MQSYRNMLLVSVDEYQNLRKQLLYSQAPEMTQDLYNIKDKTSTLPPDQQIALEGEVLRQHIKQIPSTVQQPSIPVPFNDDVVVSNFKSFIKTNKVRAGQVYQHLKAYKTQWNEMGQMLDANNVPIPNSNIVELVDYVTNTKKSKRIPAGFEEFRTLLTESQLPRNYLSTPGLTRVEDYKHLQSDASEEEDIRPAATPIWKRLRPKRLRR